MMIYESVIDTVVGTTHHPSTDHTIVMKEMQGRNKGEEKMFIIHFDIEKVQCYSIIIYSSSPIHTVIFLRKGLDSHGHGLIHNTL